MLRRILASAMLFMPALASGQSQSLETDFGTREQVENISLSPSGNRLSYISPTKGQGNRLYTVQLDSDGQPKAALSASGDPERIDRCDWVSEERLVCQIWGITDLEGEPAVVTRLIAVNADGSEMKLLSNRQNLYAERTSLSGGSLIDLLPGDDGAVLVVREYIPENHTGSRLEKNLNGYAVDRVDTLSLKSKKVVSPNLLATDYISDGQGNVRIMELYKLDNGLDTGVRKYQYRLLGKTDWRTLGDFNFLRGVGFEPIAVDPTENVAYGFEAYQGRTALYKVKLDETLTKTLVFARDDVDVDGLITLGRQKHIVGATFATDRRQVSYFDPQLAKLQKSLIKVLPNTALLNFGGMSADEQKVIVWAGSDTNSGEFYLYDKVTKNVRSLMLSHPALEGRTLSPVKSVKFAAADGIEIPGYLTLPVGSDGKNLPAIVMPHGGPSARDEWGFDWLAQYFAQKGYAVLQPNFRGSTGYGDDWYQNNGFQSWRVAIGDVNDAGRWLAKQGIADPKKLAIVGWSYGGYAALQSAVLDPDLFKAVIAIAPVTDLAKLKEEWKGWMNYNVESEFIGVGKHIVEGSPAQNAERFKAPVLMFHGDKDRNVLIFQSRFMEARLRAAGKTVTLVEYKGLDHGLEDSQVRAEMLKQSSDFLAKTLGIK
jgi:dipeptidyl aminopeptidase/acylaminoacyl peptidase